MSRLRPSQADLAALRAQLQATGQLRPDAAFQLLDEVEQLQRELARPGAPCCLPPGLLREVRPARRLLASGCVYDPWCERADGGSGERAASQPLASKVAEVGEAGASGQSFPRRRGT
jgi:hypothetical protein